MRERHSPSRFHHRGNPAWLQRSSLNAYSNFLKSFPNDQRCQSINRSHTSVLMYTSSLFISFRSANISNHQHTRHDLQEVRSGVRHDSASALSANLRPAVKCSESTVVLTKPHLNSSLLYINHKLSLFLRFIGPAIKLHEHTQKTWTSCLLQISTLLEILHNNTFLKGVVYFFIRIKVLKNSSIYLHYESKSARKIPKEKKTSQSHTDFSFWW